MAVAVAALVVDDIVDDEDEDDGKICSALLPFSDAGPVWSSIMRLTISAKKKKKKLRKAFGQSSPFEGLEINIHTSSITSHYSCQRMETHANEICVDGRNYLRSISPSRKHKPRIQFRTTFLASSYTGRGWVART